MAVEAASAVSCLGTGVLKCTCSSKFVTFGFSLFQRLERCVGIVTSLTNGLSEREANDALNAHVSVVSFSEEKSCLDEIIRGILYLHGSLSEGAGIQAIARHKEQADTKRLGNGACCALAALSLLRIPRAITVKRQNNIVLLILA